MLTFRSVRLSWGVRLKLYGVDGRCPLNPTPPPHGRIGQSPAIEPHLSIRWWLFQLPIVTSFDRKLLSPCGLCQKSRRLKTGKTLATRVADLADVDPNRDCWRRHGHPGTGSGGCRDGRDALFHLEIFGRFPDACDACSYGKELEIPGRDTRSAAGWAGVRVIPVVAARGRQE